MSVVEPEALAVRRELGDDVVPLWAENALAAFSIYNSRCPVLILLGNKHKGPSGPLSCPWLSSSRSPSGEKPLKGSPATSCLDTRHLTG